MKFKLLLSAFFLATSLYSQRDVAKRRIDSLVNSNKKLVLYKNLNYCYKLKYIDSLVCNNKEEIFYEPYFKLAMLDITFNAKVDTKIDFDDFSKAYFSVNDYNKVARKCKKN